jgi:cyclopropane fatty-acyl-phospholipid synthase-like methyltransferase
MTNDWVAYFDRLEDSPLHRAQSALYVRSLSAEVGLHRDQRVLDFGCGFGFVVALLAPLVSEVWWWDQSPNMRAAASRATAELYNTRPYDLSPSPLLGDKTDRGTFDLILVNSVAQYMTPDELWSWIGRWRDVLSPDGRIVLSDLIPHEHGQLSDMMDLFRFAALHGSPFRAATQALGDVGGYRRASRAVPLVRVGARDLTRHASDAGLETRVLPRNLTQFKKRWTALLHRPP